MIRETIVIITVPSSLNQEWLTMRKLNLLLSQSAREWNISIRFAVVLVLVPVVGAVLLAVTRLHYNNFRFLTAEDGPIEWLSFGAFALAFVFGLRVALLQWRA